MVQMSALTRQTLAQKLRNSDAVRVTHTEFVN